MRNDVEHPRQLARAHIVGVNIGGGCVVAGASGGQRRDDQVLENAARVAGLKRAGDVAIQAGAQIGAAVVAEAVDGLAGAGVESGEESAVDVEQAPVGAVLALPIIEAAGSHGARVGMNPYLFAGGRVQSRDDGACLGTSPAAGLGGCASGLSDGRRGRRAGLKNIHYAVDHDGVEDKCAGPGGITPNHFQLFYVGFGDLLERGILRGIGAPQILGPGGIGPLVAGRNGDPANQQTRQEESPDVAPECLHENYAL